MLWLGGAAATPAGLDAGPAWAMTWAPARCYDRPCREPGSPPRSANSAATASCAPGRAYLNLGWPFTSIGCNPCSRLGHRVAPSSHCSLRARPHCETGGLPDSDTLEDACVWKNAGTRLECCMQVDIIGRGSFGVVVRAQVPNTCPPEDVAIKLLPRGVFMQQLSSSVEFEVLNQARLIHPLIIRVMEVLAPLPYLWSAARCVTYHSWGHTSHSCVLWEGPWPGVPSDYLTCIWHHWHMYNQQLPLADVFLLDSIWFHESLHLGMMPKMSWNTQPVACSRAAWLW